MPVGVGSVCARVSRVCPGLPAPPGVFLPRPSKPTNTPARPNLFTGTYVQYRTVPVLTYLLYRSRVCPGSPRCLFTGTVSVFLPVQYPYAPRRIPMEARSGLRCRSSRRGRSCGSQWWLVQSTTKFEGLTNKRTALWGEELLLMMTTLNLSPSSSLPSRLVSRLALG